MFCALSREGGIKSSRLVFRQENFMHNKCHPSILLAKSLRGLRIRFKNKQQRCALKPRFLDDLMRSTGRGMTIITVMPRFPAGKRPGISRLDSKNKAYFPFFTNSKIA